MANAAKPDKLVKPLSKRQIARQLAVQTLYAWNISGNPIEAEAAHILTIREEAAAYDAPYFKKVLAGMKEVESLDGLMKPYLSRAFELVSPIELAILRLAVWELSQRLDIPYRVVINEAIELSKVFGAQDSHKFVNGVLDRVSKQVRADELKK
jgi:N utilization substance protein B